MSKIKVTDIAPTSSNTPSITLGANSNVSFANGVTATSFTGDGANLTNLPVDLTQLDAQNLTSGTIPDARFPATLPAASGANLTSLSSSNLSGALPALDGSALTGINAGALQFVTESRVLGSNQVNTIEWDQTVLEDNKEYYMEGTVKYANGGGPIFKIDTEVHDINGTTYSYGTSYHNFITKHWSNYSGSQSSSEWYVYDNGSSAQEWMFRAYFRTTSYPGIFWESGGVNSNTHWIYGKGSWSQNPAACRIKKLRFGDNYSWGFVAPTNFKLYKFVHSGFWG